MTQPLMSVILVGKICSGKSTLANVLSQGTSFPIASFGKYVKDYAIGHGISTERSSLQNLGQYFIENDPEQFLKNVITYSGTGNYMIFEGVRHLSIFNLIKQLSHKSISFFLDVPTEIRFERLNIRDTKNIPLATFLEQDNHEVEKDIDLLLPLCDYKIDTTADLDSLFEFVKNKLNY